MAVVKKKSTIDDYKSSLTAQGFLDKSVASQQSNINAQAEAQKQQAYILNQKMYKYLGTINSAYGQNGLRVGDAIGIQNQYAGQLGQIDQAKNQSTNDMYAAYANEMYGQKLNEEDRAYNEGLTADQRAYQDSLIKDDRAYNDQVRSETYQQQQALIDQEYARQQTLQDKEEIRASQYEIRGMLEGLISSEIESMLKLNPKMVSLSATDIANFEKMLKQYQGRISQEDYNYLMTYIKTLRFN